MHQSKISLNESWQHAVVPSLYKQLINRLKENRQRYHYWPVNLTNNKINLKPFTIQKGVLDCLSILNSTKNGQACTVCKKIQR